MKTKKLEYLLFLIISIILINNTNQIYFVLEPYENICMSKNLLEKSIFSGFYFISGEEETGNMAIIKNPENHIIWNTNSQKSGSFNLQIEKGGNNEKYKFNKFIGIYSFCIHSLVNRKLTSSFELHDEKKDKEILSVSKIFFFNKILKIFKINFR